MNRRAFLGGLLAIPVVAVLAPLLPKAVRPFSEAEIKAAMNAAIASYWPAVKEDLYRPHYLYGVIKVSKDSLMT